MNLIMSDLFLVQIIIKFKSIIVNLFVAEFQFLSNSISAEVDILL